MHIYVAAFFVAVTLFMSYVYMHRTGVHEAWLLSDIWIGVVCLAVLYSFSPLILSHRNLILTSSLFYFALLSVPLVKNEIPVGSGDVMAHLALTRGIIQSGNIPIELFGKDFPLFQLLAASYSLVTWMPPSILVGNVSLIYPIIIPLFIYVIGLRTGFPQELVKYGIFLSFVIVYGGRVASNGTMATLSSLYMVMLVHTMIYRLVSPYRYLKRSWSIIIVILMFSVVLSHSLTPLMLLLALATCFVVPIYDKLLNLQPLQFDPRKITKLIGILFAILFSWYMFVSRFVLNEFIEVLLSVIKPGTSPTSLPPLGSGINEIGLKSWLHSIIVNHVLYIEAITLSLISIIFMSKLLRSSESKKAGLSLWAMSSFFVLFASVLVLLRIGAVEYVRALFYSVCISSLLSSISIVRALNYLSRRPHLIAKVFSWLMLVSLVFVPLLQLFPVESPGVALNYSNSVYQLSEVTFVFQHYNGTFASTSPIYGLIYGFTEYPFQQQRLDSVGADSLYSAKLGFPTNPPSYQGSLLMLTYTPGAGGFVYPGWPDHSGDLTHRLLLNSNVIYSNGLASTLYFPE